MTEQEAAILDFEEVHPQHRRAKEPLIRERFHISPARYYQIRNRVLRTPEGVAAHPVLARRALAAPIGVRAMFDYAR